jgi:hypothetical protein
MEGGIATQADIIGSPDFLQVDETLQSGEVPDSAFVQKEVYWIQDQQNGTYVNSIVFDSTQISNSGKWLSMKEGWITVPYNISLRSSVDVAAGGANNLVNSFIATLKQGHHLVDAIEIQLNGVSVHSQQAFKNQHIQYELMTNFSNDSLNKMGSSLVFHPDSSGSSVYRTAASVNGRGVCNNLVSGFVGQNQQTNFLGGAGLGVNTRNEGLCKRLEHTAFPANGQFAGFGNNSLTADQCAAIGKNHMRNTAIGGGADCVWQWCLLVHIKLPHLANIFDRIGLCKGTRLRMTVYFNSCDMTVNCTSASGNITVPANGIVMRSGRTNPVIVASSGAAAGDQPLASVALTAGDPVLRFSCGIASSLTNGLANGSPLLNACRMYIPVYTLNPDYEEQLYAKAVRKVEYEDLQSFFLNGGGAGYAANSSFNILLTNGLKNLDRLILMLQPNPTDNGGAGANINPITSPFDSAPSTTMPASSLTNFQVLVSGKNVFNEPNLYTFQNFLNELSKTGLNGSLTDAVSSGLISQRMFENNYAYYTVDLARRLKSDDGTPMSVQVNGTNSSARPIDIYAFLVYRRSLTVDLVSGDIKNVD